MVILCGFTGWLQDRVLWQPLRRRGLGLTQLMIVTIGLSLALQYTYQYFVGARTVRIVAGRRPPSGTSARSRSPTSPLVAMAISIVVLRRGRLRAPAHPHRPSHPCGVRQPGPGAASGIDIDKVIRLVWTIAMALAGLSGLLYALVINGIKWDTGLQILLLLFAAVTLGGLGTAFGALVGSLIIGLVVELSPSGHPG